MSPSVKGTAMKTLLIALLIASPALAQLKKPGQPHKAPVVTETPPGPEQLRPKVEALLKGYEFEPRKEDWEKLGPGALDVLVAIASDEKLLPSTRSRALASMNHFPDAKVSATLATFATSTKLQPSVRATAAEVLVARDGQKALAKVSPLLSASDPLLRETAAKSIARLGTPEARKTLESRLEKDQDPAVREAIQRGLAPSR